MASLTPEEKGAPPDRAPRLTRYALLAGVIILALAAPGLHYGPRDELQVAAVKASRGVPPVGRPKDDPPREPKKSTPTPTPWIQASHSFVCPADGTARLRLKVRGVSESCQPRYSWTTNGGVIEGDGADIIWNLTGIWPQPGKYYDAVVTVKTGPACGSRKASAIWRACVVCWARIQPPPPPPTKTQFCPSISFGTRATATAGQNVPVTATLNGGTPGAKPKFKWTVLAGGRLDGGRDTDSILVEAGNVGQTILAKVEVGGYRSGPPCSATCSIPVVPPPPPTPTPTPTPPPPTPTPIPTPTPTPTTTTLRVLVMDMRDGQPIDCAQVVLFDGDGNSVFPTEQLTDESGNFERTGLNPGVYHIKVIADGFTEQARCIALGASRSVAETREGCITLGASRGVAETFFMAPVLQPPPPTPTPTPTPTPCECCTLNPGSCSYAALLGLAALCIGAFLSLSGLTGALATTAAHDEVHCTVFAPPGAPPGRMFLVQVYAHFAMQAELLKEMATKRDAGAEEGGSEALEGVVERGKRLTFVLDMPGLTVDRPERSLVWNGKPDSVCFRVTVPKDFEPNTIWGAVEVLYETVPIGEVMFQFTVGEAAASPTNVEQEYVPFRKAFVSYCHTDMEKVLEKVQMLEAENIEVFMDKISLEAGDDWQEKLYQYIDQCDVFFLFWSSAAKCSREVEKEWAYALERRKRDAKGRPLFKPVPIEGPPVVEPPPALSQLHFDSRYRYFIKGAEAASAVAPSQAAPPATTPAQPTNGAG